jgi:energy-coupling factor transport system permease protein
VTAVPPHPFTLLAVAAGLPALAWLLPAPWGGAAAVVLAIGLCWSRRVFRAALLTAAPFWLFLFLLHDPARAVVLGLRLSTMIASFIWLAAALPPAHLVEALVAARWPATTAYLFAATLSAVPALQTRARRLVDAQRCRGLATRGSVGVRFRALGALALPLVLSALHEVDERALALETRGLATGARRTPLHPPVDSRAQMALRWGLAVACGAALWWRFT